MKKFVYLLVCSFALFATSAHAVLITADATGTDNFTDVDYWGISLSGGAGFVSSVTFDITPFGGDFFDFDGSASFADETAPVIGALSGIDAADITSSFIGDRPTEITFDFALDSFSAGDSFRFSADIDQILAGNDLAGLLFSVSLQDGSVGNGVFATTGVANQSGVSIELDGAVAVAEPSTLALLGLGLVGVGLFRKRMAA